MLSRYPLDATPNLTAIGIATILILDSGTDGMARSARMVADEAPKLRESCNGPRVQLQGSDTDL
jgi:hypothetical protein